MGRIDRYLIVRRFSFPGKALMPFRFPRTVVFLILAFVLTTACHSKRSADVRQLSPLTPVAQEIQRRGYHAQDGFVVPPAPWEVSTFGMRSKLVFSFRADQPLPNEREKYYCRFSLAEEAYDSVDAARRRLTNLHDSIPGGPVEDEYILTMRTGFRTGTVTYILQTDAAIFWPEVKRLAKDLAASTPGAELTAIINTRRTQVRVTSQEKSQ